MWAENPDYGNIEDFFQLESSLDEALKKKAWSYLQVRLSLLLKGYPTTLQVRLSSDFPE